jgi:choline dehydrogenase-like flavoprotein
VDDPSAAVDAKARVIGLQKLMAIDASAFPQLPPVIQCLLIYLRAMEAMKDVANGSNASV